MKKIPKTINFFLQTMVGKNIIVELRNGEMHSGILTFVDNKVK